MKKLIIFIVSLSLLFVFGCENKAQMSERTEEVMKYGMYTERLPYFEKSSYPADMPVVYEENGLFGYKDPDGSVYYPAVFTEAGEFKNGFANVVEYTGDGYDYDLFLNYESRCTEKDYEYNRKYHLMQTHRSGGCGYVDAGGKEVVPAKYDSIVEIEKTGRVIGFSVDEITEFDLQDGYVYRYEPYDEKNKDKYIRVIDLSDYDLAIVKSMVVVNGESDIRGTSFPVELLQKLDWNIYEGNKRIYSGKIRIVPGPFDGTIAAEFGDDPNYKTDWFAVPSFKDPKLELVHDSKDSEDYEDTINSYLKDRNIGDTPYKVNGCFTGNFISDDKTSAVINILTDPELVGKIWSGDIENWPKDGEKSAFFSAIIFVPDINDKKSYIVINDSVNRTARGRMSGYLYLISVADVSKEEGLDMIVLSTYYEGMDAYIKHIA